MWSNKSKYKVPPIILVVVLIVLVVEVVVVTKITKIHTSKSAMVKAGNTIFVIKFKNVIRL